MPPDSTNPSPTQEVETWIVRQCACGCIHDRPDAGCPECGGRNHIAMRVVEAHHLPAPPEPGATAERFDIGTSFFGGRYGLARESDEGDWVRFEAHQHLLQAEVEKREEAVKERESLVGELATLLGPQKPRPGVSQNDQFIAAVTQLLIDKEAAESRLSSVEALVQDPIQPENPDSKAGKYLQGYAKACDDVRQLLRHRALSKAGDGD